MRNLASKESVMKVKYEVRQYVGDTKDDYVVTMVTPKRWVALNKVKRNLQQNIRSQMHIVYYESNPKASIFLVN